ncbi:MAG: hypothetical protein IT582_09595 [Opitutaceae bacterium]|nr:hypothetical protein [Opitutaceae bacterium]
MRTTVDLPASLIRRLKQRARQEGVPMKTVYNRALARAFGECYTAPTRGQSRVDKPQG